MRAQAVSLAHSLARGTGSPDRAGGPDAETADLLTWLGQGRFTFLGYREYDLVQDGGRAGPAGRARHRPGPAAARPARFLAASCRPRRPRWPGPPSG